MDKELKAVYSADLRQGEAERLQMANATEVAANAAAAKAATKCDVVRAAACIELQLKSHRTGKISLANLTRTGLAEAWLEYEVLILVMAEVKDNPTIKWWLSERIKHSPSRSLRESFNAFLKARDDEGHKLFNNLCDVIRATQKDVANGKTDLPGWAVIQGENLAAKRDKHARLKAAAKTINHWLGEGKVCYTA